MMMAAAAQNLDEEPHADPAEAPMSAADFRIIERAHQLCDHAPARELTAELAKRSEHRGKRNPSDPPKQRAEQALTEGDLIPHAVKILGAQIRAVALVREMKERGEPPLFQIIEKTRPMLAQTRPTKQRIHILWAAAKAARKLGAEDDVVRDAFMALAVESNLIDRGGRWTGDDVRDYVRRHGAEDVEHVITWALRGWNPFEEGPLK
jgi:hypothetical protein